MACKSAVAFFQFSILANYFWLLVEGMYLQTLLALTFVLQRKYFWWYILTGWGQWIHKSFQFRGKSGHDCHFFSLLQLLNKATHQDCCTIPIYSSFFFSLCKCVLLLICRCAISCPYCLGVDKKFLRQQWVRQPSVTKTHYHMFNCLSNFVFLFSFTVAGMTRIALASGG